MAPAPYGTPIDYAATLMPLPPLAMPRHDAY